MIVVLAAGGLMRALVAFTVIALGGCVVVGGTDVDRAARDGSSFLQQAFVEHRYDEAARGSPGLDATRLRAIVDGAEREMGALVDARPMSSAPALDRGAMFVWYRVRAAHASGNVGLLVTGDARRGYHVESLHVDAKAAPDRWPGSPFVARAVL